jgi:serine/threonine protein phosphatase PrpC/DNA-directed RNA polymerase subunit RPC12/RpoP
MEWPRQAQYTPPSERIAVTDSSPQEDTVPCPNCGENTVPGKYCERCGNELPSQSAAATSISCPHCGGMTLEGAKFCEHCGKDLAGKGLEVGTEESEEAASIACSHCGEMTLHGGKYCEHCGQELPSAAASTPVTEAEAGVPAANADASATLVLRPDDLKKAQGVPQPGVRHMVAFKTDIGHKHHVNQDAGGAWTWLRPDGLPASLIIVADGVSAGRSSEGASKLVVDVLEKRLSPLMADPQKNIDALVSALLETAREANIEVAQRPHHSISSADATTLVAALCVGEEGGGVWCGDSRVYHVAGQHLTRLTRDHSWAEGVVSHGIMSAEDAARDPRAHMITRWLGPPEKEDPGIETFRFTLSPDDIVMCCTDGLYMYFAPPASEEIEMAHTLASFAGNLQAGIDHLVDIALQRGGRDNVTAAAISRDEVHGEATEHTTELPVLKKQAELETVHLRPRPRSKRNVR